MVLATALLYICVMLLSVTAVTTLGATLIYGFVSAAATKLAKEQKDQRRTKDHVGNAADLPPCRRTETDPSD